MRRKILLRTIFVIALIGLLQLLIYKKINQAGEVQITSYFSKTKVQYNLSSFIKSLNHNVSDLFICAKTKQVIPIDFFNDDYCDCEDGSDEPLTSACLNIKFFCKTQVPLIDSQPTLGIHYIFSSQVNDGICDCCDGSDEWNKIQVSNTCNKLLNKISSLHSNLKIGLEKKKKYIKEGKHLKNKLYGVNGEYYPLSHKCLYHLSAGYKYKVCPFESITQTKLDENGGRQSLTLSLGKSYSVWMDGATLLMTGGSSNNCPHRSKELFDNGRKSQLKFKCGSEDKIISSYEPQPCLYIFEILTPAAC